jgi:hypothetical protein
MKTVVFRGSQRIEFIEIDPIKFEGQKSIFHNVWVLTFCVGYEPNGRPIFRNEKGFYEKFAKVRPYTGSVVNRSLAERLLKFTKQRQIDSLNGLVTSRIPLRG